MNFLVRKIHKYLSFFISLQLLLWTVSGIYFAFNKIELVRGEQYLNHVETNFDLSKLNIEIEKAKAVEFKKRLGQEIVIIKTKDTTKYLNMTGQPLKKISMEDAMNSVSSQTILIPFATEEVVNEKSGSEYRGRSLPIYRVKSKNEKGAELNVYINTYSAEVVAIRSNKWKIWDLMWGFHIMDWKERDNIDNLLLKIFSILALVSSVTGIMLFFKIDFKDAPRSTR
ncbi:PepSY domain-containing protein [Gammaproteobacteria bacterium]|nr:PepSY domain-containing protein [Gammaproteobacteria bacterium]MDA9320607.1 PepSY domain-containing protein [Gammaproteobacteria bacterium]MDC0990781.1 PepSY domain-containing protein [Gammaproteobacteria bacterium]MDC3306560.1 PepSY domain-containing protein [Gammaproteobacteria bacterium]